MLKNKISMNINKYKIIIMLITVICCTLSLGKITEAKESENTNNNYTVIIDDQADLLSDSEETVLIETMKEISEYGNVGFVSLNSNNYGSTSDFARDYYHAIFETRSGTIFVIDMDNRKIYIFSDGEIYRTITNSYADSITDNVYKYATNGEYFTCANKAFSQILDLLQGRKIAQPMKHISNLFLALITALLICYFYARIKSSANAATDREWMKVMKHSYSFTDVHKRLTHTTKVYSPVDSGGSGSGGGGGSSGGGGGHSF